MFQADRSANQIAGMLTGMSAPKDMTIARQRIAVEAEKRTGILDLDFAGILALPAEIAGLKNVLWLLGKLELDVFSHKAYPLSQPSPHSSVRLRIKYIVGRRSPLSRFAALIAARGLLK